MSALTSWSSGLRLLLVDDHQIFIDVLSARLSTVEGVRSVEGACSVPVARALLNTTRPDLVLLNYHLDGHEGIELLTDVARLDHPPRVIMTSSSFDESEVIASLRAGANGWAVKGHSFEALLTAISEVLRGHLHLPPMMVGPVMEQLLNGPRSDAEPTFVDNLSPRELEVLQLLVAGLSRAEVAKHLVVSHNTVRTHVQNLLKAAHVHSTLALVAVAREAGVEAAEETPGAATG
jgi:DNA-binding NarL/FixJ family response regulator